MGVRLTNLLAFFGAHTVSGRRNSSVLERSSVLLPKYRNGDAIAPFPLLDALETSSPRGTSFALTAERASHLGPLVGFAVGLFRRPPASDRIELSRRLDSRCLPGTL